MLSPPYHPRSNGQVERFVQSFKQSVRKGMTAPRATLDEVVMDFLAVYRNTIHTATGNSPARLLLNRDLRCQFDLLLPPTPRKLDGKLQNRVRESQEKQKTVHDLTARDRDEFQGGDWVLVRHGVQSKEWKIG